MACLTSLAVYWTTSQPGLGGRRQGQAAGLADRHGRLRVDLEEDPLDRRPPPGDSSAEQRPQLALAARTAAPGIGRRRVGLDDPGGPAASAPRPAGADQPVPAARQPRVDPEHEHAFDLPGAGPRTGWMTPSATLRPSSRPAPPRRCRSWRGRPGRRRGRRSPPEAQHLLGLGLVGHRHRGGRLERQLGRRRRHPASSRAPRTAARSVGGARQHPLLPVVAQVLGAGVHGHLHDLVLAERRGELEHPLAFELPAHGAGLGHRAAVAGEQVPDLGTGAVAVVGQASRR